MNNNHYNKPASNQLSENKDAAIENQINFRSPSWFANYTPPTDVELVGDKHIQKGAISVLAGSPGVGKSLATTSLAIAGATGDDWFGLQVHKKFKTMILQAENSKSRLKGEYMNRENKDLDQWIRISEAPKFGFEFEVPAFRQALKKHIAQFNPDLLILDPWNHIAKDDNVKTYNSAFQFVLDVSPMTEENPAIMIIAHTRKPNHERKVKGRDLMHEISGSHKLYSLPRSVIMIQPNGKNSINVECCKNNDGSTGSLGTWKYENLSFKRNNLIDLNAIPDTGITLSDFEDVLTAPMKKSELVRQLMSKTGKSQSTCYSAINDHIMHLKTDGKMLEMKSAA